MTQSRTVVRRVLPTSPFQRTETPTPTTAGYRVGARITHDRYGLGRIVAVDEGFIFVKFSDGAARQFPAGVRGLIQL